MTTTMKGIPVLHVEADCIARAWELSLIELHQKGCDVRTEYDKPEDPPSKDATMMITITDPLKEPMIHRDMPGGPEDLQEYVMDLNLLAIPAKTFTITPALRVFLLSPRYCWPDGCSRTCAASGCRATAEPTGTPSCCGRCPARTR